MACSSPKVKSSDAERNKLGELDRETATYLRHFFHNHNGTSAMVVIYDECSTIILVKLYKSKPYDTLNTDPSFNQNHAEKFLVEDGNGIISQTSSNYEKITKKQSKEAKFRMCIFQSNSPCEPCSSDFITFKQKIDEKISLVSGEIEFQVARVWKYWRNKDGLRRMFGYQGKDRNKEFTWKEFDWFQFYDAFYNCVLERKTQTTKDAARFVSEKDIVAYLYDISTPCAIDLICEEKHRVKEQIASLSKRWKPQNTCTGCWKSKDVLHCHYCKEDGHSLEVCHRINNLPSLERKNSNVFLNRYGNYHPSSVQNKPQLLQTPSVYRNFEQPGSSLIRFQPPPRGPRWSYYYDY